MSPRIDRPVVAVTGINASDNPAPGIGVAKSLKAADGLNATVIGLAYDAMEPGAYLDWCLDRTFIIPYPNAGHEALIERLKYIKAQCGLDVVIPTLDSELPFFIRAREELAAAGIQTFLPELHQFRMRDKQQLPAIATSCGLAAPEQRVVTSEQEALVAVSALGFPVMVKGALYGAHRANTMEDALRYYAKVVAEWGYPVLIQRAVQGEELNVIGVGDGMGGAPGLVAIKKLTTTGLGKIWTGVTIDHPGLIAAAHRFASESRWGGAFELECIVDGPTIHLIEINPRFPAWVYFATGVGVNLPQMLVERALGGKPAEPPGYESGRLYIRYTDERVCDMARFQQLVTLGESA